MMTAISMSAPTPGIVPDNAVPHPTDDADYFAARAARHDHMAADAQDSATRDIHRRFASEYRRRARASVTAKSTTDTVQNY